MHDGDIGGFSSVNLDYVAQKQQEPAHVRFHGRISTELPPNRPPPLACPPVAPAVPKENVGVDAAPVELEAPPNRPLLAGAVVDGWFEAEEAGVPKLKLAMVTDVQPRRKRV